MDKFAENLQPELKDIVFSKDWKRRQSSLEIFLKQVEAASFKPNRNLVELLIHSLKNEKHGQLTILVIKIFESFTRRICSSDLSFFEKHYKKSLGEFLSRFYENKQNILTSLHSAINIFNSYCNFDFVVSTYALKLVETKKPPIRCQLVKSLFMYFDSISSKQSKIDHSKFVKNVKSCCQQLAICVNDSLMETRDLSIKCLGCLRSFAIDDNAFDRECLYGLKVKQSNVDRIQAFAIEFGSSVPMKDTTYENGNPSILQSEEKKHDFSRPVECSTVMKRPKCHDIFEGCEMTPLPKRSPMVDVEVENLVGGRKRNMQDSKCPIRNLSDQEKNFVDTTIPENFASILQLNETATPSKNMRSTSLITEQLNCDEIAPTKPIESICTTPLIKKPMSPKAPLDDDSFIVYSDKSNEDFHQLRLEVYAMRYRCDIYRNLGYCLAEINTYLSEEHSKKFINDEETQINLILLINHVIQHCTDHIICFILKNDSVDETCLNRYVYSALYACVVAIKLIKTDLFTERSIYEFLVNITNLNSVMCWLESKITFQDDLISKSDVDLFQSLQFDPETVISSLVDDIEDRKGLRFSQEFMPYIIKTRHVIREAVNQLFEFYIRHHSLDEGIEFYLGIFEQTAKSFTDSLKQIKEPDSENAHIRIQDRSEEERICYKKTNICTLILPATSMQLFDIVLEKIIAYVDANQDSDFDHLSNRCGHIIRSCKFLDSSTKILLAEICEKQCVNILERLRESYQTSLRSC